MLVVVCIVSKLSLVTSVGVVASGTESEVFLPIANVSDLLMQPMLAEKIPNTKKAMANLKTICLYCDELALFELKLAMGLMLIETRYQIIKIF